MAEDMKLQGKRQSKELTLQQAPKDKDRTLQDKQLRKEPAEESSVKREVDDEDDEEANYIGEETTLKRWDVLVGRCGGTHTHHPGHRRLREIMWAALPFYNAGSRKCKTVIILAILDCIRSQGGRFICHVRKQSRYYLSDQKTAHKRISSGFRDARQPKKVRVFNQMRKTRSQISLPQRRSVITKDEVEDLKKLLLLASSLADHREGMGAHSVVEQEMIRLGNKFMLADDGTKTARQYGFTGEVLAMRPEIENDAGTVAVLTKKRKRMHPITDAEHACRLNDSKRIAVAITRDSTVKHARLLNESKRIAVAMTREPTVKQHAKIPEGVNNRGETRHDKGRSPAEIVVLRRKLVQQHKTEQGRVATLEAAAVAAKIEAAEVSALNRKLAERHEQMKAQEAAEIAELRMRMAERKRRAAEQESAELAAVTRKHAEQKRNAHGHTVVRAAAVREKLSQQAFRSQVEKMEQRVKVLAALTEQQTFLTTGNTGRPTSIATEEHHLGAATVEVAMKQYPLPDTELAALRKEHATHNERPAVVDVTVPTERRNSAKNTMMPKSRTAGEPSTGPARASEVRRRKSREESLVNDMVTWRMKLIAERMQSSLTDNATIVAARARRANEVLVAGTMKLQRQQERHAAEIAAMKRQLHALQMEAADGVPAEANDDVASVRKQADEHHTSASHAEGATHWETEYTLPVTELRSVVTDDMVTPTHRQERVPATGVNGATKSVKDSLPLTKLRPVVTNDSAQVEGTLTRGGMQATGAASLKAADDVTVTLATGESLALAGRAASMVKQTRPKFAGWQHERMALMFTSAPIEVFIDTKSDERHQKGEESCLDKSSPAAETKIAENAELRPETVRSINLTSNDRASRGTLETEISDHTCESTSVTNAHQSHALPTHEQTTDEDQPQHDERLVLLNVVRRRLMRHMTAHAKLIEMLNDDKVSASHLALLQEETEMITSSLSACKKGWKELSAGDQRSSSDMKTLETKQLREDLEKREQSPDRGHTQVSSKTTDDGATTPTLQQPPLTKCEEPDDQQSRNSRETLVPLDVVRNRLRKHLTDHATLIAVLRASYGQLSADQRTSLLLERKMITSTVASCTKLWKHIDSPPDASSSAGVDASSSVRESQ